jgi:hypothetical protein
MYASCKCTYHVSGFLAFFRNGKHAIMKKRLGGDSTQPMYMCRWLESETMVLYGTGPPKGSNCYCPAE